MNSMTSKRASLAAAAVAWTLLAVPASADENAARLSNAAVRETVIAMSLADAALPAATASAQTTSATNQAMAAMPARAIRRARQVVYDRVAYDRRIRMARSDFACSGFWCGQFPPLMLGVGF